MIVDLVTKILSGKTTAVKQVKSSLAAAKKYEDYHALLEINPKALEKAQYIDEKVKKGFKGKLAGVPFIAKDNFLTYETETTAASKILKGFRAPYQATAIERLEAEGAILLAKANLDEFAHGTTTENSAYGPTKNPYNESRVAGGSSGGPAAAVALDIVPFGLGTDTGGSIRLPASFCGVVGYKPTYGLVSRYGVIAMASSTDVIGPLTHSVEDAAYVLDVIAGKDRFDSTMTERDVRNYEIQNSKSETRKLKVGVIKEYFGVGLDSVVRSQTEKAIEEFKKTGARVEETSLPSLDLALAAYYIIVPAEISSNLARYDGIRFGLSHPKAKNLDDVYDLTRTEGFGREAKRRIMIGTHVLSSGYYDAYYKKAMQVRTLIIQDFAKAFEKYDVLVGPVAPSTAFKLGETTDDPLKMYLADVMTVGVSLAGLPAISVPVGLAKGLPAGLQIIGAQNADRKVLEVAKFIEEKLNG
jgi:aspartyl-tRNA(Asn)/glutamyl-tRNA(Gln) amidotransferase subunit A